MADKFIAVANRQEADRAAKYLERLGYILLNHDNVNSWDETTKNLSTIYNTYYYSNEPAKERRTVYGEEQLFVPDDFETIQEAKEEHVLSGVWQYFNKDYETWEFPSHFAEWERKYLEGKGYQTRDLYIKV